MISFSKLGNYGRLGNQLFQYAFLRATAHRLGVDFYCPQWDGDAIFDLCDCQERVKEPSGILYHYDPHPEAGYVDHAMRVDDNTEIQGFFQSEKFYRDKKQVTDWYQFRPSIVDSVERRYPKLVTEHCVSMSLRIDADYAATREYFPLYPVSYYKAALKLANPQGVVLVFADRIDLAKEFFSGLSQYDLRFVEGLGAAEQLYLMSQCRANIIINSTFAWWGAWLNTRPDRTVYAPSHWCRPGVPRAITDILCEDWVKVPGTTPVWDHFQTWRLRHPVATLRRVLSKVATS